MLMFCLRLHPIKKAGEDCDTYSGRSDRSKNGSEPKKTVEAKTKRRVLCCVGLSRITFTVLSSSFLTLAVS
jgi:hypothetical protein